MARAWKENALAFDVWKYHASVGGADKDRMVQVTTWLLGFSAAILGLYATGELGDTWATILLLVIGILVSALAGLVALLYGGYATWNWAIADQIAEAQKAEEGAWSVLLPANRPIEKATMFSAPALWMAKPRPGKLAPIFWLFFVISILSAVVHAVVVVLWCATR